MRYPRRGVRVLKRCPCCGYATKRLPVQDVKTTRDPRDRKHELTYRTHKCPKCSLGCASCPGIHTTREEYHSVQRDTRFLR